MQFSPQTYHFGVIVIKKETAQKILSAGQFLACRSANFCPIVMILTFLKFAAYALELLFYQTFQFDERFGDNWIRNVFPFWAS